MLFLRDEAMGYPTLELILALRHTAERLRQGAPYRWTHQGACNCGHLAQTVTKLPREEIHRRAVEKAGDGSEHAIEYCPKSGYPIDHIIESMLAIGRATDDLVHLERLTDPKVLARIEGTRHLDHRSRDDVVLYLEAWADLLEEQRAAQHAAKPRAV